VLGTSWPAEERAEFYISHLTAGWGVGLVPDKGRARRGVVGEEPGIAVRAAVELLHRPAPPVPSTPFAGTIEYPASAKAATMRAARASGSPRAVSLIVFAMICSTAGLSAFVMAHSSSSRGKHERCPSRFRAGWPPLVNMPTASITAPTCARPWPNLATGQSRSSRAPLGLLAFTSCRADGLSNEPSLGSIETAD
jgi:hypothetical protein